MNIEKTLRRLIDVSQSISKKKQLNEVMPVPGLAGIGVVTTFWLIHLINFVPVQRETAAMIYVGQVQNIT